MKNTAVTVPRPPVTQLRPLHTYQQLSHQELSISSSKAHHCDPEVLEWASTIKPSPDKNTAIKAFVTLVSRIVVLNPGETYCIQDAARGGFILGRSGENAEEESFCFLKSEDDDDIPTDFSIGEGKTLQLHIDASTGQIRLAAYAVIIPAVALEALGHMLEDLIASAQQNRDHGQAFEWTQPSVLNFPPESRPLALFPGDNSYPDNSQHENGVRDADKPALLHRWFEERVLENPDRTALDFLSSLESGKRTQYTYQQVENSANALAVQLGHRCEQSPAQAPLPNKTVAVLMGPCPELYISYMGALKAGMAFCPIPLDSPEERRNALIADLQPVAVLVSASTLAGSLLEACLGAALINVTEYLSECDIEQNGLPASSSFSVRETDVAYILYTSGTTGMPKGVPVSHISVACTISALNSHYKLASSSSPPSGEPIRWFQGAAPTFDISLFETFWTLSTGSTLCCAPRELTLQDIDRVVTTLQADMTNITPSFASLLDPKSIGGLMVGGETLNSRLLRAFAQYNPSASNENAYQRPRGIYNGYGPTETAIYCVAQAHVPENQRGSVLGTPLATCGILIVEESVQHQDQEASLEHVPMGATGELVIAGQQVSRMGYLNRPNETSRAFVNHARWGRVYRTGDRARIVWDSRGEPMVEFLGRLSDDQVKLSGRRVELGEVESVLANKVEGVREALCCIWRQEASGAGSEKIVSLVVPDPRANLTLEIVQQRCHAAAARHLPNYMRPFKILQVDALPMSASGKLDRKAASAHVQNALEMNVHSWLPESTGRDTTEDIQPLSDPEDSKLEEELVSIAAAVLPTSSGITNGSLTATTRLADAGMDSLYAMKLLRDHTCLYE